MNDLSDWIQSNWFELGSLLVQSAVLLTLAWYGRKVLRILAAPNNHSEAPRRLAPANFADEQPTTNEAFAAPQFESPRHASVEVAAPWPGLIEWLRTPMGSGGTRSNNRVIRWLQTPIGS